ncbi:MAG TPA: cytochrome c [Acidimicrobiales bacterium]
MSTTDDTNAVRRRSRSRALALMLAAMLVGSLLVGVTARWRVSASDASPAAASAPAQAPTCVEASNSEHARAGRAFELFVFVFARGSWAYIGLSWETTALQEGPTGTWTKSCGPGTTTTTRPTTTTTRPTTTTTRPTTTTTRPTTTTTVPGPDGRAIYQASCAGCHGAEGEGGVGPSLRGIGEHHSVAHLIEVITNGRGGMPAWEGRLTPAEIEAVATYVSTIPGEHTHDH